MAENDVAFLKSTVVNDNNMKLIHEKLISTLEYRFQMLKAKELDLLEAFPYFFCKPQLVSDFF